MDKVFLEAWDNKQELVREWLGTVYMGSLDYKMLFTGVVSILFPEENYRVPCAERIVEIDHGEYQGTIVFVVGAGSYQPSDYWSTFVEYGSCSGCDTLQAICSYSDGLPDTKQVLELWTLCLHMVQRTRKIVGYDLEWGGTE